MTKKVVRPILPIAPDQYDPVYINQLARALETLIDEVRDADVNFQGIGEMGSATSLDVGDMYIADAGFLRGGVRSD